MTSTLSHGAPARFQLAGAETWANPWPMYEALRDHDPVHHVVPPENPDHDYWVLSRHTDVWEAAREQRDVLLGAGPDRHLWRTENDWAG